MMTIHMLVSTIPQAELFSPFLFSSNQIRNLHTPQKC